MKKKIFILIVVLTALLCCIIGFSACSTTDKYGKEETYYDLNSGNTVYFDGNGKCNFCGAACTYEIKNGNYYVYGNNTLNFKKVKDGVLVDNYRDSNSFLNVSVSSGYISGNFLMDNIICYIYTDGSFRGIQNNSLVSVGNYYFNDGVLMLEYTGGITEIGIWVDNIQYSAIYVNEGTGKLSGVLLANPSYYKQWHFDNNSNNQNAICSTLTYDYDYEDAPTSTQAVKKGENVNLIMPERAGYEFLGWYYSGSKIESGVWQYDHDITLTARWKEIEYTITYHTGSGILPDYCLTSFTVSSNLPYTLPIPTKQGFNFVGWYANADFSGEPITVIPNNSLNNYVLYAKYTDKQLLEFELSFDGTYYSVIGYNGTPQYISVPETKDGLPIKEISAKAFEGSETLINIILPDSIYKIGSSAFYGCNSLTNINIPDGVTNISSNAFVGCRSLTSITIPDSVTSIGAYAFSECTSLTNVIIPDGVTSIFDYAFYGCTSLTSIIIPDGVTSIFDYAFYGCTSLTSITIPDSVTTIGSSAFPDNFYKRYSGCYYLPTKNSDYGFLYKPTSSDITDVKIHSDCKTINRYAFYSCNNLTSAIIPDSVTIIGYYAFNNSSKISIFYKGTADGWSDITINYEIRDVKLYYFSITEPTDDDNYWHYCTNGTTPVIWKKEN